MQFNGMTTKIIYKTSSITTKLNMSLSPFYTAYFTCLCRSIFHVCTESRLHVITSNRLTSSSAEITVFLVRKECGTKIDVFPDEMLRKRFSVYLHNFCILSNEIYNRDRSRYLIGLAFFQLLHQCFFFPI